MTKRRKTLFALVGVLVLGVVLWAFFISKPDPGPSYNDKTLSEWVTEPQTPDSAEALRHIGTNAIPYLLNWINYERPHWKYKLSYFLNSHFGYHLSLKEDDMIALRAIHSAEAFQYLGKDAILAIPFLRQQVLGRKPANSEAMQALAYLGPSGLPTLMEALTIQEPSTRVNAMSALRSMGTNA